MKIVFAINKALQAQPRKSKLNHTKPICLTLTGYNHPRDKLTQL
jgi:hypothetical protein